MFKQKPNGELISGTAEENSDAMAFTLLMARDMAEYGVPHEIIGHMVATLNKHMYYINESEAKAWKVNILEDYQTAQAETKAEDKGRPWVMYCTNASSGTEYPVTLYRDYTVTIQNQRHYKVETRWESHDLFIAEGGPACDEFHCVFPDQRLKSEDHLYLCQQTRLDRPVPLLAMPSTHRANPLWGGSTERLNVHPPTQLPIVTRDITGEEINSSPVQSSQRRLGFHDGFFVIRCCQAAAKASVPPRLMASLSNQPRDSRPSLEKPFSEEPGPTNSALRERERVGLKAIQEIQDWPLKSRRCCPSA